MFALQKTMLWGHKTSGPWTVFGILCDFCGFLEIVVNELFVYFDSNLENSQTRSIVNIEAMPYSLMQRYITAKMVNSLTGLTTMF